MVHKDVAHYLLTIIESIKSYSFNLTLDSTESRAIALCYILKCFLLNGKFV